MSDGLHFNIEQLIVYYKNKPAYAMNKKLLDQQNCWENLEKIKQAHVRKLEIYSKLRRTRNKSKLRELGDKVTEIEFELQGLWKFPLDKNFHRFWEYPKCTCPKLDNADWYPHLQHISADCPLHGDNK